MNGKFIKKIFIIVMLLSVSFAVFSQTRIKMQKKGNLYTIPCIVNGLKLHFVFDTGASNVCISLAEATFMLKNGYLRAEDIVGKGKSKVADGSLVENTQIILREIEIGGMKLYNVNAVIVNNIDAPLLLGQSAIQKLGVVQLQGDELVILSGKSNMPPPVKKSAGANWFVVYKDDEEKNEIDLNSIKRENEYVVCYRKVTWINEKRREKEAKENADVFCQNKSNEECLKIKQKWKNYQYDVDKDIFNCKSNSYAAVNSDFYDKSGSVIHSYQSEKNDVKWRNIPPETIISNTLDYICGQLKISYKGQTYWMYIEDAEPFLKQYPEAEIIE